MDIDKKICGEFVSDGIRTIYSSLTEDEIPERITVGWGEDWGKNPHMVFRFITMTKRGERHIYVPLAVFVIEGLCEEELERVLFYFYSDADEEDKMTRRKD